MSFLSNLKLDTWWGISLYLGTLLIVLSLTCNPSFVSNKHLMGLGFGLIALGFSYFMAEKEVSFIKPPNAYTGGAALISGKKVQHNLLTRLISLVGFLLIVIFGYMIISTLL